VIDSIHRARSSRGRPFVFWNEGRIPRRWPWRSVRRPYAVGSRPVSQQSMPAFGLPLRGACPARLVESVEIEREDDQCRHGSCSKDSARRVKLAGQIGEAALSSTLRVFVGWFEMVDSEWLWRKDLEVNRERRWRKASRGRSHAAHIRLIKERNSHCNGAV